MDGKRTEGRGFAASQRTLRRRRRSQRVCSVQIVITGNNVGASNFRYLFKEKMTVIMSLYF